ncbi:MAG: EF-hand domain-containing protein [Planctomycetes bacterium]|nr:EF-hand domain-containing protein [Planctomycetota bacterium]
MRRTLPALIILVCGMCVYAGEAEPPPKKKAPDKLREQAAFLTGVPALRLLDTDSDNRVTPEEKGAFVNGVIKRRMAEAKAKYEALSTVGKESTSERELFVVPEIKQYETIVAGLTERADIFRKIYAQFRLLDTNGDDRISGTEFAYAARLLHLIRPITIPIDRNANGMIGDYEITLAKPRNIVLPNIKLFREGKWSVPEDYVVPEDAIVRIYDIDKDGGLTIKESQRLAVAIVNAMKTYEQEAESYQDLVALLTTRYKEAAAGLKEKE